MEKNKVKVVFIVLVYRNYNDVIDFCLSIKKKINMDYKIVIVNSFFDIESEIKIKNIAEKFNCDFLNIENKGYGYGNNEGINYAREKYKFNYLIISNPDIIIEKFNFKNLEKNYIYAPNILTRNGKKQNPFRVINSPFLEYLKYIGFKKNMKFLIYIDILINKLCKIKRRNIIYSCHGSFIIFGLDALNLLPKRIFNDDIFLFTEEDHLAKLLYKYKIKIIYNENLCVKHNEDGSMKYINKKIFDLTKESYIKYYEYWKKE